MAYLLTRDIATQIEAVPGPYPEQPSDLWEIWVRDEDQLPEARSELSQFVDDPRNPKYSSALSQAKAILAEKEKKRQAAAKNLRRVIPRGPTGMARSGRLPPLTLTLLILSVAVSLFSSFSKPKPNNNWGQAIVNQLSFVQRSEYIKSDGDPAANLKQGEVWRIITPIFLHLGPLHLAMNMLVLISFGRMVEGWLGTPRYALFVLLLAIGPNLLQGLSPDWMRGSPFFGGMSGVLYGLFGYVWIRSTLDPTLGVSIPFPIVMIFVGMIVIGLSGAVPDWPYAELCHLGGLLIGCALAFATEQRGRS